MCFRKLLSFHLIFLLLECYCSHMTISHFKKLGRELHISGIFILCAAWYFQGNVISLLWNFNKIVLAINFSPGYFNIFAKQIYRNHHNLINLAWHWNLLGFFYITALILFRRKFFHFNDLTPNQIFLLLKFKYPNLLTLKDNRNLHTFNKSAWQCIFCFNYTLRFDLGENCLSSIILL